MKLDEALARQIVEATRVVAVYYHALRKHRVNWFAAMLFTSVYLYASLRSTSPSYYVVGGASTDTPREDVH